MVERNDSAVHPIVVRITDRPAALGLWPADALRAQELAPEPLVQQVRALRAEHASALGEIWSVLEAGGHRALLEGFVTQQKSQDAAAREVSALNRALAADIVASGLVPAVALWARDRGALSELWPLSDWSELQLGMPCSRRFVRHSYTSKPVFRQAGRATCGRDGRYLALIVACLRARIVSGDTPNSTFVIAFFDVISTILAEIQILQLQSISRTGHFKVADTAAPAPAPVPAPAPPSDSSGALLVFPPQAEHTSSLWHEWTERTQRLIGRIVGSMDDEDVSLKRPAIQAQRVLLLVGMVLVEQLSGERSPTFDADLLFQRDYLGAEPIADRLPGEPVRPLTTELLRLYRRSLTEQDTASLRLRLRLMTLLDLLAQRLSALKAPLTFADVLREIEALRPGSPEGQAP